MATQRSRLSGSIEAYREDDQRPRLRVPLIPTLVGTLALMNIASAVLALIN
jgi:hypothetical protein